MALELQPPVLHRTGLTARATSYTRGASKSYHLWGLSSRGPVSQAVNEWGGYATLRAMRSCRDGPAVVNCRPELSRVPMPDFLHTDDRLLWLLIGVCLLGVLTIEAVEAAVEGAWPHQRRPTRMLPRERSAHAIWGIVALLVLPGILLEILNLGVLVWRNLDHTETQVIGSIFVGIGWVIFLLISIDRLPVRRYLAAVGPVAPIALLAILLVGDVLLLTAFIDIRPSVDEVRDALPTLTFIR